MADCKPASRNNRYKLPVFRLDFRNTRKWDNASWFRRNKKLYFRRSDLTSVITPNAIMQVAGAKKNAAAPKKDFASRFPKKDSRTNAKFAVLKTRSKGAFARGRKLIIRRLWRLSRERRRFAPPSPILIGRPRGAAKSGRTCGISEAKLFIALCFRGLCEAGGLHLAHVHKIATRSSCRHGGSRGRFPA